MRAMRFRQAYTADCPVPNSACAYHIQLADGAQAIIASPPHQTTNNPVSTKCTLSPGGGKRVGKNLFHCGLTRLPTSVNEMTVAGSSGIAKG